MKSVLLHADNCSGQNKNTIMFWYLMWRVLIGRHSSIRLSFLIAGHTKFAPDWAFGLAKKRLRVTKVDCLDDIALAISTSSIVNRVQLVGHGDVSVCVPTYDSAGFLGNIFKRVSPVRPYHHFLFSDERRGVLLMQEQADGPATSLDLLRVDMIPSDLPRFIHPKGLSYERQLYLFKEVREFVATEKQDVVAPAPTRGPTRRGQ